MPRKKEVGQRIRKVAKGEEVRAAGRSEVGCARAVGAPGGRGRRAKWERALRTDMLVVIRGRERWRECEMVGEGGSVWLCERLIGCWWGVGAEENDGCARRGEGRSLETYPAQSQMQKDINDLQAKGALSEAKCAANYCEVGMLLNLLNRCWLLALNQG